MLLEEIAIHIDREINNLTLGENLFLNHYPEKPNNLASVIDIGGVAPNRYSPIREKVYEIKFRAENYADGIKLGNRIMKIFHSKENYSLGDFFILASWASSEITYLYADTSERDEFTLSIAFQYRDK